MQCYHCEEFQLNNDCSQPQSIVNCTVNIQDACQKEVIVRSDGTFFRKACASFSTCLLTSAGYQAFCTPTKVGSICISCCNTPLCNGPRAARKQNSTSSSAISFPHLWLYLALAVPVLYSWTALM
uniref:ly6/PLAUR domain-containing protein 1-like n=1 Tax=Pristiophorus japonicus TaxID=55135 RepID=UPI00398E857E